MIQSLMLLFIMICLPNFVFANISVGDTVRYKGTITDSSGTRPITLVSSVQSINAQTGLIELLHVTSDGVNESRYVQTADPTKGMLTCKQGKDIVANCAKYNGELQKIKVAGKDLMTCMGYMDTVQATLWIAAVPFSYAKLDKSLITYELVSYSAKDTADCD